MHHSSDMISKVSSKFRLVFNQLLYIKIKIQNRLVIKIFWICTLMNNLRSDMFNILKQDFNDIKFLANKFKNSKYKIGLIGLETALLSLQIAKLNL